MRALAIAACLVLAACAAKQDVPPPPPPEAAVVTVQADKVVPVSCKPTLPPRPALQTKDQIKAALAATPNLDDQLKLVADALLTYIGWTPIVEAALKGCQGVPSH